MDLPGGHRFAARALFVNSAGINRYNPVPSKGVIRMLQRISHARAAMVLFMLVAWTPGLAQTQESPTTKPAFILGADISTLTQVEQRGGVFKDKQKPGEAIAIFVHHG